MNKERDFLEELRVMVARGMRENIEEPKINDFISNMEEKFRDIESELNMLRDDKDIPSMEFIKLSFVVLDLIAGLSNKLRNMVEKI